MIYDKLNLLHPMLQYLSIFCSKHCNKNWFWDIEFEKNWNLPRYIWFFPWSCHGRLKTHHWFHDCCYKILIYTQKYLLCKQWKSWISVNHINAEKILSCLYMNNAYVESNVLVFQFNMEVCFYKFYEGNLKPSFVLWFVNVIALHLTIYVHNLQYICSMV